MVKYCGRCGQGFKENQKFCASCGWSVTTKKIEGLTGTEKPFQIDHGKDRGHQGLVFMLILTVLVMGSAVFFTTDTGQAFKENVQEHWESILNNE